MSLSPEQLKNADRQFVWHAFTQMSQYEPLVISRARGCWLVDVDGREYLDGVSSLWCNVHGHAHPRLNRAIADQLEQVAHVTSLGMGNVPATELAWRLTQLVPAGLNHVFFSSDGSSAVEVGLKMAFQYWQQTQPARPRKTRFVALHEAYHGDTLGSVSVGGVDRFHSLFRPLLFDAIRAPLPDAYRLPPGITIENATDYYLARVEEILEQHHEETAGLVVEPLIQGAAGMVMHPPGLLRGLRELTRKYDVLLIADEVAVGFGRTGTLFACEQEGVAPDLLCLGKGLTAGYLPMSATLATTSIWDAFLGPYHEWRQFSHGHTYGGNPLAAAVALASLDIFQDEHVLESMVPKVARLQEHLSRWESLEFVGDRRQCGLVAGIELVADRQEKTPLPFQERWGERVCRHAFELGVWVRPLGNVVVIMPPLSISLDELDLLCRAVEQGLERENEAWLRSLRSGTRSLG
jgi:adenosylmethionine---8-amino-7-oxononanoate aminotransferase